MKNWGNLGLGGALTSEGPGLLHKKKNEWEFAVDGKDNFREGGLDVVHFLAWFGVGGTQS